MAREINLVPDVKNDMIRTLKMRNIVFFISIVVGILCAIILAVFGTTVGGQEIAKKGKQDTLDLMSSKIQDNEADLKDYLTIRDQLTNLNQIASEKQVLSRTFSILNALLPHGADTITISELNVRLSDSKPQFSFDAQANAGREPFIDYNVLDSFKKSMEFMYYDYGNYVDKDGNKIPAYCIVENGDDGSMLKENESIYALWTIESEGCNPGNAKYIDSVAALSTDNELGAENEIESEATEQENGSDNTNLRDVLGNTSLRNNNKTTTNNSDQTTGNSDQTNGESSAENGTKDSEAEDSDSATESKKPNAVSKDHAPADAYETMTYNEDTENVVKIWRTPQFDDWYKDGHMTTDGTITDVPHFESECIDYSGQPVEGSKNLKWDEQKNCKLVPSTAEDPGISISDSSNGRGAGDELVLRFSAVITLDPAVYLFNNFHMRAIPPADRVNVTDSYVQIQSMFGEAARACDPSDTACTGNTQNLNGGNN